VTPLVPLVLFGWIGIAILLFSFLPPRRAVIAAYMGAWMFLPNASYFFPGVPDFNKSSSASLGVALGILIFDFKSLLLLSPKLPDLFVIAISVSSFFTSISNGLGAYDGLSAFIQTATIWVPPYVAGRLYFTNATAYRELAIGLLIGGLIYMPLCWFELRFSPQLHRMVYGFFPASFLQHMRDGGYRPVVFMKHGLMTALWMAMSTIAGFWLWRSKYLVSLCGVPMIWLVAALMLTTIGLKSMNAMCIMLVGIIFYYVVQTPWSKIAIIALLCVPALWVAGRATSTMSGTLVKDLASHIHEERANSLSIRMIQEDLFGAKARQRPLLGWGGWGRMFPVDENDNKLTRGIDGMWVIMFGSKGAIGLVCFLALLLLAPLLFCIRQPRKAISAAQNMPLVLFCTIAALYAEDCLFNGMINPVFLMSAAGFAGVTENSMASDRTIC